MHIDYCGSMKFIIFQSAKLLTIDSRLTNEVRIDKFLDVDTRSNLLWVCDVKNSLHFPLIRVVKHCASAPVTVSCFRQNEDGCGLNGVYLTICKITLAMIYVELILT
jgi:hypothetical protein